VKNKDKLIDSDLEAAFQALKNVKGRDEKLARHSRSQFLNQAAEIREAVSAPASQRHNGWKEIFNFKQKEKYSMLTTLTTVLLVLSLVLGGTGGTVYAAQSSLPDDALYPLKLFTENMQEAFTANAGEEMELQLQFANRRMEEIAAMNGEGKVAPDAVVEQLQTRLQNALHLAASLNEEEVAPALLRIQEQLRLQEQTLLQLHADEENTPLLLRTREMLREQIRLVGEGLEEPLQLQQQLREQERINQPGSGETELPADGTEEQPGYGPGPNTDAPGAGTCTPMCIGTCTPNASYGPGPFGTPEPGGNGQGGKP
jgi:hypothetical protein